MLTPQLLQVISESQSHRGESYLWRSPGPIPALQAGPPRASCSEPCPEAFEDLKDEESTTFLGNLCQSLLSLTVKITGVISS